MSGKQGANYQDSHRLAFAVIPSKTAFKSGTGNIVEQVSCRFCLLTGGEREEKVGAKRKPKCSVQVFSTFKPGDYENHHTKQHPSLWNQYQKCKDSIEKEAFFDTNEKAISHLMTDFYPSGTLCFFVHKSVVDVLIAECLLTDLHDSPAKRDSALNAFKKPFPEVYDDRWDEESFYCIQLKNPTMFNLTVINLNYIT